MSLPRIILLVPNDSLFPRLASYGIDAFRQAECEAEYQVVAHPAPDALSILRRRWRTVGLLRASDEFAYSLIEAWSGAWARAMAANGLREFNARVDTLVPNTTGSAFGETMRKIGPTIIACIGATKVAIERLPREPTCVNIHPGMLPWYRGVGNPEAIMRGDRARVGLTIHAITSRLDAGPTIMGQPLPEIADMDFATGYIYAYMRGIDTLATLVGRCGGHATMLACNGEAAAYHYQRNLWRVPLSRFIWWRTVSR